MPQNKINSNKSGSHPSWQGRSGLDPVDTYRIQANVEGVFLRRLFTFNLRTRNIISLITMLAFGVSATGLMAFAIYAVSLAKPVGRPDLLTYLALTIFSLIVGLVLLIGLALLVNFSINLGIIFGFIRTKSRNGEEHNQKKSKKKLPKRRKDFK